VGGQQFEHATDSLSRTDVRTASLFSPQNTGTRTATVDYSFAYSLPAGWEITSASGTLVYDYALSSGFNAAASVFGVGVNHQTPSNGGSVSANGLTANINRHNNLVYTAQTNTGAFDSASASITLRSASITINRRRAITQTAATTNHFNLVSRTVNIAGAQVLATGTLNWMAVGE